MIPTEAGRIPMSDGAGTIEAVGAGVTQFKPGDLVVSTFFTDWDDGAPPVSGFTTVPGDGIDGYAREAVIAARDWFFANTKHRTAVSYTHPANDASHRLAEAIGAVIVEERAHGCRSL